jgi:hypothetical protein
MPVVFALVGSVFIHLGVLFGTEWELPGLSEPDTPLLIEAVLAPAAKTDAPAPRKLASLARPAAKPKAPRSAPVVPVPSTAADVPAAVSPAPTFDEPPPVPVVPAPTEPRPVPEHAVPAALQIALPARGSIRFSVFRGTEGFVVGQSIHEWTHDGSHYQARSVTETTGIAAVFKPARVVQASEGRISAGGLQPVGFRHEKLKGTDTAAFDWERHLLSYDGKEVILPDGTQDMLSLYYQAGLLALSASMLELPVATGRKLERYRFNAMGEEALTVDGKEWRTLHLAAKNGTDGIELWIAPELHGLPLKIRFVDRKGEIFDQIAVAIELKQIKQLKEIQ